MENSKQTQRIIQVVNEDFSIRNWMEGFILDCQSKNLAGGTIKFYRVKLQNFLAFCDLRMISEIQEISPQCLREYILWLESTSHSPGGCHAFYRTVKAFLKWYERENDLDYWKNPINKVQGPRVRLEPLEPVKIEIIKALLSVCGNDFYGVRDKLILLMLMDTGMRANELTSLNIEDINPVTGVLIIKHGKGGKFRNAFLGRKSRQALRRYLKFIKAQSGPLYLNRYQERLAYDGLRGIIDRLAKFAGVNRPSIHSFRRLFALQMLRSGTDIFSLQLLMGHSDIQVLRRYLKQTNQDIYKAYIKGSPVDKFILQ